MKETHKRTIQILTLDGPRGVGKDAILGALLTKYPDRFQKIVTNSTRPPREGEVHGVHHFFISNAEFEKKLATGEIFEHTNFHGTYRGMSRTPIDQIIASKKIAVVTCDVIGVRALKRAFPNRVLSIFVTADKETMKKRLFANNCPDIDERMLDYEKRHEFKNESDLVVKNDTTIDDAVAKIMAELK